MIFPHSSAFRLALILLPLVQAVSPVRARADSVEQQVRLLKEAFTRFEKDRQESQAALRSEIQAREQAERQGMEARERIRKLETELERRTALLQAETSARQREAERRNEAEARLAQLEQSLREAVAMIGRLQSEAGQMRDDPRAEAALSGLISGGEAGGSPGGPEPRMAVTSLRAPIPVSGARVSVPSQVSEAGPSWDRVREEFEKGNLNSAADMAAALSKSRRTRAEEWALLGQIEFQRGLLEAAVKAYGRAVSLEPRNTEYLKALAMICHASGDLDGAIEHFSRVVALNDDDGESHFNLAALHLMLPKPDPRKSAQHYQRALRLGEPRDESLEQILFR